MLYKELQEMITNHIFYKEISNKEGMIMRIWCVKDNLGEYSFTIKLGGEI
jgi:hypothetical protein